MMLTWFAQELASSCVAACVRMVLNGLGDIRDEAQVRQLIGYTRLGVSLAAAQARLVEAGAAAELHTDWNLADLRDALRAGHHPIVDVERHLLTYPRAFHAIVLVNITSATVEALDPLDGPAPCRYGIAAFTEAWELAGREALLIERVPAAA
jgi:ABC-type bacteriocin/lantibiotic exporter with double-glycine peptidase domain